MAVALAAGLVMAFLFGMYTTPNHGGPAYGSLEALLERALGDSPTPLPGPPRKLPVQPLGPDSSPPGSDWPPMPEVDSVPAAWLAAAVAADRDAVRAWLGPAVLATSSTAGDTARTVLWRLTLRPGCPVVSRFEATSVGRASRTTRFTALASSCPRPPGL